MHTERLSGSGVACLNSQHIQTNSLHILYICVLYIHVYRESEWYWCSMSGFCTYMYTERVSATGVACLNSLQISGEFSTYSRLRSDRYSETLHTRTVDVASRSLTLCFSLSLPLSYSLSLSLSLSLFLSLDLALVPATYSRLRSDRYSETLHTSDRYSETLHTSDRYSETLHTRTVDVECLKFLCILIYDLKQVL